MFYRDKSKWTIMNECFYAGSVHAFDELARFNVILERKMRIRFTDVIWTFIASFEKLIKKVLLLCKSVQNM